MKKLLGFSILALSLFALLGTAPAYAGEAMPAESAVAAAPAPVQSGCGEVLNLTAALSAKAEICPATADQNATPEFMAAGRTCRCSCGFPCKTDADCGGGVGSCRAGVTCC